MTQELSTQENVAETRSGQPRAALASVTPFRVMSVMQRAHMSWSVQGIR